MPRKLLLRASGKSILQHTYEAASAAGTADEVIIAAADAEIAAEARKFGAAVVMTDPDLPSGTDRVAAVALTRPDADLLVNVQGDEPELAPAAIDAAVKALRDDPRAPMSTLAAPIRTQRDLQDPACVKVVFDDQGRALYFSRSPIPFPRDGVTERGSSRRAAFLPARRAVCLPSLILVAAWLPGRFALGSIRRDSNNCASWLPAKRSASS